MPTYQYACTNQDCAHRFEQFQSFTDAALTQCPVCSDRLRKVYGSVGVVFKGSGFYRNDARAEANGVKKKKADADSRGSSDSSSSSATSSNSSSESSSSDNGTSKDKSSRSSDSSKPAKSTASSSSASTHTSDSTSA